MRKNELATAPETANRFNPVSGVALVVRWAAGVAAVRRKLLAGTVFMLVLVGAGSPVLAAEDGACIGKPSDITAFVTVDGVRSDKGLLALTLYFDEPDRFLKRKGSYYVARLPAVAPRTRICFTIPEPGVYGIAVYHDENANKKIDRFGFWPTEGGGFSNNASAFWGIPDFADVRIRLDAGTNTQVTLNYPTMADLDRVTK